MNSFIYRLSEAKKFLEQLSVDANTNALWDILHSASWHEGIDWIVWLEDNRDIINEVIKYPYVSDLPLELKQSVWRSINGIRNIKNG